MCALDQRRLQVLPLAGLDDQRDMGAAATPGRRSPCPRRRDRTRRIRAGSGRLPRTAATSSSRPRPASPARISMPVRPHRAVVAHHLVVDARQRSVVRQQLGDRIGMLAVWLESGGHGLETIRFGWTYLYGEDRRARPVELPMRLGGDHRSFRPPPLAGRNEWRTHMPSGAWAFAADRASRDTRSSVPAPECSRRSPACGRGPRSGRGGAPRPRRS